MRNELAVKLALHAMPGGPLYAQMEKANEIHTSLNGEGGLKPFPQVDIVFAEFTHILREECSPRERDLVMVSELLTRVWTTTHTTIQVLNETPSSNDSQEAETLVPALHRLGLLHLLTKGLEGKALAWVESFLINTNAAP